MTTIALRPPLVDGPLAATAGRELEEEARRLLDAIILQSNEGKKGERVRTAPYPQDQNASIRQQSEQPKQLE